MQPLAAIVAGQRELTARACQVGGEKRLVTGFTSTLLLRTEKEEGGIALLEITEEYLTKIKTLRDKVECAEYSQPMTTSRRNNALLFSTGSGNWRPRWKAVPVREVDPGHAVEQGGEHGVRPQRLHQRHHKLQGADRVLHRHGVV